MFARDRGYGLAFPGTYLSRNPGERLGVRAENVSRVRARFLRENLQLRSNLFRGGEIDTRHCQLRQLLISFLFFFKRERKELHAFFVV
jgi:hypothetical protein